jgi:glycosyltransferase involved in cell wall biosynthesis
MKVIHVYNQGLHHDVRTRRYGQALTDHFSKLEFYLIGQRLLATDELIETLSERVRIYRLHFLFIASNITLLKFINFTLWTLNVFFYILKQKKIKIISAHSLKVLPVCVIASLFNSAKLIYDTHEIETHTTNNKYIISLLTFIEKICMLRVKEIIVTSPGHYKWYKDKYNLPVLLIRNCPSIKEKPSSNLDSNYDLKKMLKLPSEDFLYIYIGVINVSRGVNVILESFKKCEKNNHILFLGFGEVEHIIKLAGENSNIHYMNPVPPMKLVNYISTADIGIHMMDSSNLNHRMALPNKPMQYMAAGLPCIVSDVEIMASLVRDANSGLIIKEGDVNSLTYIVNNLKRKDIEEYSSNSQIWFTNNNWELESLKLTQLYDKLI